MKKIIFIVSLIICIGFGSSFAANVKSKILGKTLSKKEIISKWGEQPFNAEKFKNGTTQERAQMAASMLDKQVYVGKTFEDVKKDLGSNTGYFWNDHIPTYILNEGWKTQENTWQLVFFLGRQGKVAKVVVNQNCCE